MRTFVVVGVVLAVGALSGCGDGENAPRVATESAPASRGRADPRPEPPPRPQPARCPAEAANCASASGTIVYVEVVDPDGDGDAHFVLSSREGVTGPGISVIDVAVDLRPDPLPEVGDAISAAGPVYRGSYGQRQIQATELHVARR